MASGHHIEKNINGFPKFLQTENDLPDVENMTMAERRKRLGGSALKSFARAEASEHNPFQHIEDTLKRSIIGQPRAIEAITDALTREALHNPNQPIANFMFLGPTGVGKSETAKILAELIDDSDDPHFDNLIRIDCSDYKSGHEVATLLGSPLGYVGSDIEPKLGSSAVEGGKTVILFDEIEKGCNELYDMMLHIMDDGTLETMGETSEKVHFNNSIIIMTSNLGAEEMDSLINGKKMGFSIEGRPEVSDHQINASAKRSMRDKFKPEFINRITDNIVFRSFDDEQLGEVVDARVDRENKRYREYGYDLTISEKLRDYIVEQDEDRRQNNARGVLRNYETMVEGGLARHYLTGTIPEGSEVYADLGEDNSVVFLHSENQALKYYAQTMREEREKRQETSRLAQIAEDESDDIDNEVSAGAEIWGNDDDLYINNKRVADLSDLHNLYDNDLIDLATYLAVGQSVGWFKNGEEHTQKSDNNTETDTESSDDQPDIEDN